VESLQERRPAQTLNGGARGDIWIYMCWPPPMMHALEKAFSELGMPRDHIRWEQFDIR
jgi:ferredoxin-NADP reductase